ncbi:phage tail tape measure protein [Azotobacter bryophylli]|uniref:Phage tail tape measure protein n=1 Tax=Azotobacter bryophylli TaxID=1986537 RepID=A0ABV7B0P1_9GAMM
MAGKSIGALSIDLVAKVGGFISGLDKAARSSAVWRNQIVQSMTVASKAAGAASAIVNGAMAVWIKSSINSAAELKNFAQLANSSTTEFQKFAAGARTVGIDNEKLADIFKDVNDKVGEFLTTGGGELKDFFDVVAPKAGVTADQFRNLSGPQALGLFVDTLEKAGANRQEMTFFMESLADDATALIPLLQNGGKGMRDLASEAENLGLILSEETIRGAKQFNDDLDLLGWVANGVGQQIAAELLPELLELTNELRDPETAKAATTMAKAVVESFSTITTGARETVGFIKWAAEAAAAFMNGAAGDDIVRLEDQLKAQEQAYAKFKNLYQDLVLPDGKVAGWLTGKTKDEHEAAIAATKAQIESYWKLQGLLSNPPKIEPPKPDGKPGGGTGLNIDLSAGGKTKTDAEKAAKAIASQIAALELQAKTLGMTEDQEKLFKLSLDGATDSQIAQARAALEVSSAYEQQKKVQEDYKQLVADLRTDEEKLTDQMHARLAVLDAMKNITPDERTKVAGQIADATTAPPPQYEGLDAVVGGPFSELLKINDAESELEKWYSTQLDMLDQFRKERADLTATWDAQELEVKQQHEDALAKIEQARQLAQLSAAESIFGDLADITKTFAGEQSGLYKAMFAVQKAAAIAQSMVAIQTGIAMAAANPFPMNLVAMASVAAATASIVGNIAAIGMAHDGIDSVPETGTWLLQKGERVTTAQTSAKLDRTLNAIQAGNIDRSGNGSGGGTTIHQTITVNGDASQQTIQALRQAAQQGAQQALSAIVSDANRNGPIIQTIRKRL